MQVGYWQLFTRRFTILCYFDWYQHSGSANVWGSIHWLQRRGSSLLRCRALESAIPGHLWCSTRREAVVLRPPTLKPKSIKRPLIPALKIWTSSSITVSSVFFSFTFQLFMMTLMNNRRRCSEWSWLLEERRQVCPRLYEVRVLKDRWKTIDVWSTGLCPDLLPLDRENYFCII